MCPPGGDKQQATRPTEAGPTSPGGRPFQAAITCPHTHPAQNHTLHRHTTRTTGVSQRPACSKGWPHAPQTYPRTLKHILHKDIILQRSHTQHTNNLGHTQAPHNPTTHTPHHTVPQRHLPHTPRERQDVCRIPDQPTHHIHVHSPQDTHTHSKHASPTDAHSLQTSWIHFPHTHT